MRVVAERRVRLDLINYLINDFFRTCYFTVVNLRVCCQSFRFLETRIPKIYYKEERINCTHTVTTVFIKCNKKESICSTIVKHISRTENIPDDDIKQQEKQSTTVYF